MTLSRSLIGVAVALAAMAASAQQTNTKLVDSAMALSELTVVRPTVGPGGSGDPRARVSKDRLLGGAALNAVAESGGLAASQNAFRIKSIDHTGITVSSLEDSLKFW